MNTEFLSYIFTKKKWKVNHPHELLNQIDFNNPKLAKSQTDLMLNIAMSFGLKYNEWRIQYPNADYWWFDDLEVLSGSAGILVVFEGKPVDYCNVLRS
jgi:hypothetical protein